MSPNNISVCSKSFSIIRLEVRFQRFDGADSFTTVLTLFISADTLPVCSNLAEHGPMLPLCFVPGIFFGNLMVAFVAFFCWHHSKKPFSL